MANCKPVKTPLAAHFKLTNLQCLKSNKENDEMSKIPYANVVRCMMYAMVLTRPDISHALNVVNRYMVSLGQDHWRVVKWVLRYLKGTLEYDIVYGRSDEKGKRMCGFVNIDFAGDLDRRRSLTGYMYMFNGCLIDWKASLQHVVALSKIKQLIFYNDAVKIAHFELAKKQGRSQKKIFGWAKFFPSRNVISIKNIDLKENFINT